MKPTVRPLLTLGLAAAAVSALALACQNYEFEEVRPKAIAAVNKPIPVTGTKKIPKVMLVVDHSGSMGEVASGSGSGCLDVYGDYIRGAACKWTDLINAFAANGAFLDQTADKGMFGLTVFPAKDALGCETGTILVQPASGTATNIKTQLNSMITPGGGTPSAPTLSLVLSDNAFMSAEAGQSRIVMLLTDGMPNCNSSLLCSSCMQGPNGCSDPQVDCVDNTALVNAVSALKSQGVDTFVIGFGAGTASGPAAQVLNNAANAGGRPRAGTPSYYQASNATELQAILDEFKGSLQSCAFKLDPPPDSPKVVQISLNKADGSNNQELKKDVDWKFSNEAGCFTTTGTRACDIEILGSACSTMQSAVEGTYILDISYASSL